MTRSRRTLLIAGAGVVALGVATVAVLGLRPAAREDELTPQLSVSTAGVERGPLVERVRASGTLAFSGTKDLRTPLGGTVTSLVPIGSVVDRGAELFRIDDAPVVLMIGALPGWRGFESGMENGRDVLQLEQNLAVFGFFARQPDQHFDWATVEAIRKWQKSVGIEATGSIEEGRIVFVPDPVRIAGHAVKPGDPAGAAVVSVTGTQKQVTAFVSPDLRSAVQPGGKVQVTLPDGTVTAGTVSGIGTPVEKETSSGSRSLKLPVTVTLDDSAAADAYSDVQVELEVSRTLQEDALLVPILALLAQSGGGHAVDVQRDSEIERVPVEVSAIADGTVAVVSEKVSAGDAVVVGI